MNSALISYQFEEEPVRVVVISGEPWFVAADVSKVLGYRMASDMTRNLDDDERGTHVVRTPSADQEMNIISESGLYAAIFKSRRDEAQRFRKWVTAEVLPAIRKTGRFELAGHTPTASELALPLDVATVSAGLNMVREARRLFGSDAARSLWLEIGLPQPIADAYPTLPADPMVESVRAYLEGREFVRASDVIEAMGLDPDATTDRRRILEALRFSGWRSWTRRIDGAPTKCWVRRSSVES